MCMPQVCGPGTNKLKCHDHAGPSVILIKTDFSAWIYSTCTLYLACEKAHVCIKITLTVPEPAHSLHLTHSSGLSFSNLY